MKRLFVALTILLAVPVHAQRFQRPEWIKPSEADPAVKQYDDPHLIARPLSFNTAVTPLVLFMPGTSGKPQFLPMLRTVVSQGFPAINLAYNDEPAVQQVCPRIPDPHCAEQFREMRLYGTGKSKEAANPVAEAIVPRAVALLKLLIKRHPDEHWEAYLDGDGQPRWSRIIVTGQSQGAGMAAYIAKQYEVPRVVLFSSPVDAIGGRGGEPAPWLKWPSKTPIDRWYAVRNSREAFNDGLEKSYPVLRIPPDHIHVFTLDLPAGFNPKAPNPYHTINIGDQRYEPQWKQLFGSAADYK